MKIYDFFKNMFKTNDEKEEPKDIYSGAVIPLIHSLTFLYKEFKKNEYGKIKWLDIKMIALAINNLTTSNNAVILDDNKMEIIKIFGAPPVITES